MCIKSNLGLLSAGTKCLLIFSFYAFYIHTVNSQPIINGSQQYLNNSKKNNFRLSGSLLTSKTDFEESLLNKTDFFPTLLEEQPPSQPYFGLGFNFTYNRKISDRIYIGIGFGYRKYGQQSTSFLGFFDHNVQKIRIVVTSFEFPLTIEYDLIKREKISYAMVSNFKFNVYDRVSAFDFEYTGLLQKEEGCCIEKYLQSDGGLFRKIKRHTGWGLWRLGFSFGSSIKYYPFKNVTFVLEPQLAFYTKFINPEFRSTVANGKIFSFNLNLGVQYGF